MHTVPAWDRSVLALLLVVAGYFQTWTELWPFWENADATYTHGTVIVALVVWLIWRARSALVEVPAAADTRALWLVLALSAAWLLAAKANAFIVHAVLWPVLAFAVVWSAVGWQSAKRLAFPLSFLYFAIPIWELLKPPLQAVASAVVGYLTGLAGIPAAINGPYITLPGGTIFIALDCSGAHFLCVALAVGVLAGVFRRDSIRTRVVILVIAAMLSMIFNWLRILLIVYAYLHPTLQHGLETMGHLTFGWWVFALDLVVFALVLRLVPLSESEPQEPRASVPASRRSSPVAFGLAVLLPFVLPATSWALTRLNDYPGNVSGPVTLPNTLGQIAPDFRWQPRFEGAAWEHRIAYSLHDGGTLELYRNEYHEQMQGRELISRGSPIFDPESFTTIQARTVRATGEGGAPIWVNHLELVDAFDTRWVAAYTYLVDRDTQPDATRAQLTIALRSLYSRPIAGLLAIAAPCMADCVAASTRVGESLLHAHSAYIVAPRVQPES